jgi:hypothetical protein
VCSMLMGMTGGACADELNLDAFERQAMEYTEGGAGIDRLQRMLSDLNLTHGMPVKRVHELMAWVRTGSFDRIVGGEYPRRDEAPRAATAEAADAAAHYSDVFKAAFKEAGEHVSSAGQQLSEWLRKQQDGGSGDGGSPPSGADEK